MNYESATYRVNEGDDVTVTVTVASAQTQDVTVPITMSGSATVTDDYTVSGLTGANNNVLTITQAQTSASFTITAVDDTDSEGNETIELGFGTINNGTEGSRTTATVTINASDGGSGGGGGSRPVTRARDCPSDIGTLATAATRNGSWSSDCQSGQSGRGYARYYRFNITTDAQVTIDLLSSVNTYLYLREGSANRGGGIA